jgi:muramidase (phage lysozyme)
MDSNLSAFLDTLGNAEGADYNTLYGGGTFSDYSEFPNFSRSFTNNAGQVLTTSAAGKYQFERSTWNDLQRRLGLPDFSPTSQDAAAVQLITDKGAINDIANGDIQTAVSKLNKTWASLPGSNVNQNTKTIQQIQSYFANNGGIINGAEGFDTTDTTNDTIAATQPGNVAVWLAKPSTQKVIIPVAGAILLSFILLFIFSSIHKRKKNA